MPLLGQGTKPAVLSNCYQLAAITFPISEITQWLTGAARSYTHPKIDPESKFDLPKYTPNGHV